MDADSAFGHNKQADAPDGGRTAPAGESASGTAAAELPAAPAPAQPQAATPAQDATLRVAQQIQAAAQKTATASPAVTRRRPGFPRASSRRCAEHTDHPPQVGEGACLERVQIERFEPDQGTQAQAQAQAQVKAQAPAQVKVQGKVEPTPRSGGTVSAKVQASLSALESMLSRERGPDADTGWGATEAPEPQAGATKTAGIGTVRETGHFFSGLSQSPSLQIAQRITHEVQIMRGAAVDQPDLQQSADKSPIRVLHIRLDPPQLGPLTIRMSLQNDALQLQLETSRPETAKLIHNDKDALSGLLRSAGYTVDGLTVHVATHDRGMGQQAFGQGSGFGQAAGQQPGSRQPEGRAADQGGRSSDQGGTPRGGGPEPVAPPAAGKPRGGSVYL